MEGFDRVVEEVGVPLEVFVEAVAGEGGAVGAELSVAVEYGEEVDVWVALERGLDREGVLVLAVGGVGVVAALGEGGELEEAAVGGKDGGAKGATGEQMAEVAAAAGVAVADGGAGCGGGL